MGARAPHATKNVTSAVSAAIADCGQKVAGVKGISGVSASACRYLWPRVSADPPSTAVRMLPSHETDLVSPRPACSHRFHAFRVQIRGNHGERQVQPPRHPGGFTDNPAYSGPAYSPIGPISCVSARPVAVVASQPTKKIG